MHLLVVPSFSYLHVYPRGCCSASSGNSPSATRTHPSSLPASLASSAHPRRSPFLSCAPTDFMDARGRHASRVQSEPCVRATLRGWRLAAATATRAAARECRTTRYLLEGSTISTAPCRRSARRKLRCPVETFASLRVLPLPLASAGICAQRGTSPSLRRTGAEAVPRATTRTEAAASPAQILRRLSLLQLRWLLSVRIVKGWDGGFPADETDAAQGEKAPPPFLQLPRAQATFLTPRVLTLPSCLLASTFFRCGKVSPGSEHTWTILVHCRPGPCDVCKRPSEVAACPITTVEHSLGVQPQHQYRGVSFLPCELAAWNMRPPPPRM